MKRLLLSQKVTQICGSENHLITLMSEIQTEYQIHFLMLYSKHVYPKRMEEAVKNLGLSFTAVKVDPFLLFRLFLFFIKNRFELIHTHLIHADLFVTLAAFVTFHTTIISTKHADNPFRKGIIGLFDGIISNLFHKKVVAISHYLKAFFIENENIDPSRLEVIHYSHKGRRESLKDIRPQYNIHPSDITLSIIARLVPYKGHALFIDVFKRVQSSHKNLKLLLVGDGPERKKLEKKVHELDLQGLIRFAGYQSDVSPFYSSSDIIVHPATSEGFGLILLEAMNYEKPILSTTGGAIPEIVIHKKTGYLSVPNSSSELEKGLNQMIKNMETTRGMGIEGRKRLLESFSVEEMKRNYLKLYRQVLKH